MNAATGFYIAAVLAFLAGMALVLFGELQSIQGVALVLGVVAAACLHTANYIKKR